jgi:hypothetical protein
MVGGKEREREREREGGRERETFRLPADPLYLLSYCCPVAHSTVTRLSALRWG